MNYNPRNLEQLVEATGAVQLTEREALVLKWLSGWDAPFVDGIASVIRKARKLEQRKAPKSRSRKRRRQ